VCFRHAGLFIYSFNVNVRPLIVGRMRTFIAHPASFVQAIRIAALTHWCAGDVVGIHHLPWQDQR
jgi:hypothetical protein